MADTKITGYAELTTPAAGDQIEIVDVSDTSLAASGTNKRIALGTLKATGAEVDTGTDDVKFVTPKAIADSSIGAIISKTVSEMQALDNPVAATGAITVASLAGISDGDTLTFTPTIGDPEVWTFRAAAPGAFEILISVVDETDQAANIGVVQDGSLVTGPVSAGAVQGLVSQASGILSNGNPVISTTASGISLTQFSGGANGSFVPGQLYLITDANKTDLGVLICAATESSLENAGSGGFLNADFQKIGDYSGVVGFAANQGVWTAAIDATVVDNDVVIWNCLHYLVADASSVDGTNPATNATAYTLLTKVAGHGYIEEWDSVLYNLDASENWLARRADDRGNIVEVSKIGSVSLVDSISLFQWGNDVVYENKVFGGNLDCLNNTGEIYWNFCAPYCFLLANQNSGEVEWNSLLGQASIDAATNTGTISSNDLRGAAALDVSANAGIVQKISVSEGIVFAANLVLGNTLGSTSFPQRTKIASANIRNEAAGDGADHTGDTLYAKVVTITLTNGLFGSARFLFDLKTSNVLNTANGQIYRNGVALGTEQSDVTGVYATKSEDITQDWNPGDTVELWVKIDDAAETVSVQNFRICYDDNVAVPSVNS